MYKSLCGDDFYPLTHSHTKWMSYDEKVEYRTKNSIPRTIDEWIVDGRTYIEAPTITPHSSGMPRKLALLHDNVECTLSVVCKEVRVYNKLPEIQQLNYPAGIPFCFTLQCVFTNSPNPHPSNYQLLDALLAQSCYNY